MIMSNRQIAEHLRGLAYATEPYWQLKHRFVVRVGGVVIRCKPTQQAILAVADKFEKARPHRTVKSPRKPTLKQSKFSITLLRQFHDDGECENAENYAQVHGMRLRNSILYRRGPSNFAQFYCTLRKTWRTSGFLHVELF